jgi:hypothetical protein
LLNRNAHDFEADLFVPFQPDGVQRLTRMKATPPPGQFSTPRASHETSTRASSLSSRFPSWPHIDDGDATCEFHEAPLKLLPISRWSSLNLAADLLAVPDVDVLAPSPSITVWCLVDDNTWLSGSSGEMFSV